MPVCLAVQMAAVNFGMGSGDNSALIPTQPGKYVINTSVKIIVISQLTVCEGIKGVFFPVMVLLPVVISPFIVLVAA